MAWRSKVARSHLSQCSKSCDLQPALNCAIRRAQGVLPCVGWGVRPVNWIYRLCGRLLSIEDFTFLGICSHTNERRIIRDNEGPLKTPTGQILNTENEMANTLNTYFSSVFTHEQLNNIPQLTRNVGNTLNTFNFRLEDVLEKLINLSMYKSTGLTYTQGSCAPLKTCSVGPSTTSNKSAETGVTPEDWKSANVTAFHMMGNRQEPVNYRGISFTSVVCKTMERLVKGKIIARLEGINLLVTLNMASERSPAA